MEEKYGRNDKPAVHSGIHNSTPWRAGRARRQTLRFHSLTISNECSVERDISDVEPVSDKGKRSCADIVRAEPRVP